MNSVEQAIKALYGAGTYGELASLYKLFDKTMQMRWKLTPEMH